MATKTKKPAKGKPRPTPDRISLHGKLVRSQPIRRLPDSVVDGFDHERLGLLEPVTQAVINAESTTRVILTRDAVANAVHALVRLAARWEIDSGFSSASADLRNHKLKALEAVVAILQIEERSAPIEKVGKYRVTNGDAELLITYFIVEGILAVYRKNPSDDYVLLRLQSLLGCTNRIPVETIQRYWTALVKASATTRPNGRPCSNNWVRDAGGPAQAAKKLLGDLMPGSGVADSRIAALKRIEKKANPKIGPRQRIDQIFNRLADGALGAPVSQEQIDAYIARVLG